MTREEIEKKIEDLEERKFMIDMIDVWDSEDRRLYNEFSRLIRELQEQLKEKENDQFMKGIELAEKQLNNEIH